MANARISEIINQTIVQATGTTRQNSFRGGMDIAYNLYALNDLVPPWWSRARDAALKNIWRSSDHLSTAIYNAQAKIVGIPIRIVAKDISNPEHVMQAKELTASLILSSEFGQTWPAAYGPFIEDVLTQDNGGFLEIIGGGAADGPIEGMPLSVRHLDSSRCQRTGDPVFPVLYSDTDSKRYKFHWTRIILHSQMPSSKVEMFGVGFCSVSRCMRVAQTLVDMVRYKQERLGSRPLNQLLIGKGITAQQIMTALRMAEQEMGNQGFARFAATVVVGSEDSDVDINKLDLTHLEPFDELTSTNLGMYLIAAAIGMDADELWPVSGKGGSEGETNLRRMRSRGRLPAQITSEVSNQFNLKYVPPHLLFRFDFQDDEEDQQRAIIKDIRGRNRERDLGTTSINIRTARTMMLRDGDVSEIEFEDMELRDGRLTDGRNISILFFTDDPVYNRSLDVVPNPLAIEEKMQADELDETVIKIQAKREAVLTEWANTASGTKAKRLKQSYYALDWLEEQYYFAMGRLLPEVPAQRRTLRQDVRVVPQETSPAPGTVSVAETAQIVEENVNTAGAE